MPICIDFHSIDNVIPIFRIELFNPERIGIAISSQRAQRVADPVAFQQLDSQGIGEIIGWTFPAE